MHQTEANVGAVPRNMQSEKTSRDGRARQLGAKAKAFEQAGDGLQRPLEHVRQGNEESGSAGDFRHQPGEFGIAQVGADDCIPLAGSTRREGHSMCPSKDPRIDDRYSAAWEKSHTRASEHME